MGRPNTFRPNAGQANGGVSVSPRSEPNLFAPNEIEPNGPEQTVTLQPLTLALQDQMPSWLDGQALMLDAQWLEGLSDVITLSDSQTVVLGLNKVLSDSQAGNWADAVSIRGNTVYQYVLEVFQALIDGEVSDSQAGNWSDAISVALISGAPINVTVSDSQAGNWQDAFSYLKLDVLSLALSDDLNAPWQDALSMQMLGFYKLALSDDLNAPWQDAFDFRTNPTRVLSDSFTLSDAFAFDMGRAELRLSDSMAWSDDVYLSFNLGGLVLDQLGVEVTYQNPRSPVRLDQNPVDVVLKEHGHVFLDQTVVEVVFGREVPTTFGSDQPQPGLIWGPLARRRGRSFGHTKG